MQEKQRLQAELTAKKIEIQALVAKKHGKGSLSQVSADDYQRLEILTAKYLDMWDEASREGHEARRGDEAFNKLPANTTR